MATIIDVARRAGVSIKTVSRVLNNAANVREQTAERVREAMRSLNYTPSSAARELRSGRSRSIGMLFSDPSSGFQATLHHAALAACAEGGYFLAAGLFDEDSSDWRAQLSEFLARTRVESLVLAPPLCGDDDLHQELADHDVACVVISPSKPVPSAHSVRMDDYQAAYELTEHLLGLGHKRLGHISGPSDHIVSGQRQQGFVDAIAAQPDAEVVEDGILPGRFRFLEAIASAERLLDRPNPPTAVFAANDETAAAVCFVAGRLGLRVPDDLSVAGFDDVPIAKTVYPPLTTVAQPFDAMAHEMVRLITEALQDRDTPFTPQMRTLDHALIIRESTGAPPQK